MVRRIRGALRSAMVVATIVLSAGTAVVALAAPAQATALGTCALGSLGVMFTPGLGLGLPPNLPHISVGLIPEQTSPYLCELLNPNSSEHAQITALSGTMNASCLSSSDVHWSMTLSGTVTSGRFSGQSVRLETVSGGDSLRCLTNSLTNTNGPATIQLF